MIPSSSLMKSGAMAVSTLALAAGLAVWVQPAPVEMQGGGAAMEAALGSSFADLSAGTMTAERPDAVQPADPVTPEAQSADTPEASPDAQPRDTPAETERATVQPTPAVPTVPTDSAAPTEAARPEATTPEAPTETVTGEALPPGVVASSPSAPARSEAFEARNRRPDPPPQPAQPTRTAEPQRESPRGNAQASARAGTQSGQQSARAAAPAGQRQASQAGNAAASNYPGEVMARLSRVPRPSVRARGSARIAFTVAGSGGLAGISVARSSGSADLDRAAVQLVQRAAPFPAPPPGAQTRFAINISGR